MNNNFMRGITMLHGLIVIVLFCSCDGYKDKLQVINKSDEVICYETAVYDSLEKQFYLAPAGDSVSVGRAKSPVVRRSVSSKMRMEKYDHYLYVYFFSCNIRRDFWSNIDSVIKNLDTTKVRMLKFSESQLDSMDWKIVYH